MIYDVLVIGGGVVGLSILKSAQLQRASSWNCACIERQRDLLTQASGSNSGIACTGVDASVATLERALIRDSISQLRPYCDSMNLPYRPCGSLVCQWPWDTATPTTTTTEQQQQQQQQQKTHDPLDKVLQESWQAGDTDAKRLSFDDVSRLEPNLAAAPAAASCQGAVHIPGEIVVDPWLLSVSFAVQARDNGADIFTGFRMDVDECEWDPDEKLWTVHREKQRRDESSNGRRRQDDHDDRDDYLPSCIRARAIVNAAGIHADLVQAAFVGDADNTTTHHRHHHAPSWEARPRRGQYRIFQSRPSTRITHPIQPVPTQFTKGIFVFSTLYDQIVVGPTALDQESRTDRTADPEVAQALTDHVQRIIPQIEPEADYVGEYVGIRPGSNHRDYQIHLIPDKHWIAAAGIRSTGLTASLGIGRHVVHLLQAILPRGTEQREIVTTPMPDLTELLRDFHSRRDGKVTIRGHEYRVTHPLTRLGWEAKTGLANV